MTTGPHRQTDDQTLAQRMGVVSELASDATHRTRNLATAIAVVQQSIEELASNDEQRGDLENLRAAIDEYEGLLAGFLEFCRRAEVPADEGFELAELVTEVGQLIRRCLPAAVTLSVEIEGKRLMGRGDAELVRQLLLGVLLALRRQLTAGGRLELTLEGAGAGAEQAVVVLAGWPIGAEPAALGAELARERPLVVALGGELEPFAGQAAEGQPRAGVRLELPLGGDFPSRRRGGSGERLLLVAANNYGARVVCSSLAAGGYVAEHVSTGAQLRRVVSASRPDLVLLDDSAGAVARLFAAIPDDVPTLILLSEEPSSSTPAASSRTIIAQRPFGLPDLMRWVSRLLAGE